MLLHMLVRENDEAPASKGERIVEARRGAKYNIEGNRIKEAHLLGLNTKNIKKGQKEPYTYDAQAVQEAVALYNNIDIVVGHTPEDIGYGQRDPAGKIGFTENVKFKEGVGLVGDIVLNDKHALYEQFMWWAKNKPEKLMLSHEAWCTFDDKQNKMTKINAVDCVAFVSQGGTTESLFKEGVLTDKIDKDMEENKLNILMRAFHDLVYEKRWPLGKTLTQAQQAVEITPVIQDLLTEVSKLAPKTQEAASKTANERKADTKEHTMEFADITLESLAENRKDLVGAIEAAAIEKHVAIEEAVAEALAKVPSTVHSDIFKAQIRAAVVANDQKLVESLVTDRKVLADKTATQEAESVPAQRTGKKTEKEAKLDKTAILALAKKSA